MRARHWISSVPALTHPAIMERIPLFLRVTIPPVIQPNNDRRNRPTTSSRTGGKIGEQVRGCLKMLLTAMFSGWRPESAGACPLQPEIKFAARLQRQHLPTHIGHDSYEHE